MLEIHLFDSGQATYCGQPLPGFPGQQPCQLFAYILLNKRHPINREALAAIFWGDCPSLAARKALRNALWRLRQTFLAVGASFEDYLMVSDESISFISSSRYWLDIEVFENALAFDQAASLRELDGDSAAKVEAVLPLYQGELLRGIYEDWALYDRERLRLLYLRALNSLLHYHACSGNFENALGYGERILQLDNTRERIHQQMMVLYCQIHDRSAALAQYKRCCQILKDELGIGPMPETQQLYQNILSNPGEVRLYTDSHPDDVPAGSPRLEPAPARAHILDELHRLQRMLEETRTESRLIEHLINEVMGE